MAENIASLVNSLARGVMLESGDANIQAYYGPYTSLDNAVAFFQNNVEPYLLSVPAGYKVGIGTQETVGGLPTWTSITLEYIYIGGGVTKAHFVPVIMSLDTEYTTLKTKVSGIAAGAEVNLNAFSKVKVGSTTIEADAKEDTLELEAGSNITITPNTSGDKITIKASLPADFIEVLEPGIYNIDANYTVEPSGSVVVGTGGSSSDSSSLALDVERIKAILGDLYSNEGDSHFEITQ